MAYNHCPLQDMSAATPPPVYTSYVPDGFRSFGSDGYQSSDLGTAVDDSDINSNDHHGISDSVNNVPDNATDDISNASIATNIAARISNAESQRSNKPTRRQRIRSSCGKFWGSCEELLCSEEFWGFVLIVIVLIAGICLIVGVINSEKRQAAAFKNECESRGGFLETTRNAGKGDSVTCKGVAMDSD